MRAVDYLVDILFQYGVTDVFGIPGGVVLDFLYALESGKHEICPHLNFHEQAAGFAASGYAQINATLGVAYATRGPGFTNLITPMADAYQESIPVLFITAHSQQYCCPGLRASADQEIDTIAIAKAITKYAVRIDKIEDFAIKVNTACRCALEGRKGPVLLDIYSVLWNEEIPLMEKVVFPQYTLLADKETDYLQLYELLKSSKSPIILGGCGVQQSHTEDAIIAFAEDYQIPILSSRGAQGLFARSTMYFGYIGSHGLRYSNFILSKADLIIVLGNRLSFPIKSESFLPLLERTTTVWVEIDSAEQTREIPNCIYYHVDLANFIETIDYLEITYKDDVWLSICQRLKSELYEYDMEYPVNVLANIFKKLPANFSIVCDVGNHEFWASRAYSYAGVSHQILYSHSFGTLGCALPKSIGIYYRHKTPVLCIVGDQGLQLNIQELQFIGANQLPVIVLLLNNHSSGMIRTHEQQRYRKALVHTTIYDGYSSPDFCKLSQIYGISYRKVTLQSIDERKLMNINSPFLLEIEVDEEVNPVTYLPKGTLCQDLNPVIDRDLYKMLNSL